MDEILANKIELYYMQLIKKVSRYIELDTDDVELIKSVFQYEQIPKDLPIIEIRKIADKAFFIISGYLKYFKLTDTGEELINEAKQELVRGLIDWKHNEDPDLNVQTFIIHFKNTVAGHVLNYDVEEAFSDIEDHYYALYYATWTGNFNKHFLTQPS